MMVITDNSKYREKPEDDGGTQIKHYLIEILDSTLNNIWTTIAMTDTGDCTHQLLQTLVEGHRYCVRVTAANKIGQSEPYEARGEVITKDPWGRRISPILSLVFIFTFRCSLSLWQG